MRSLQATGPRHGMMAPVGRPCSLTYSPSTRAPSVRSLQAVATDTVLALTGEEHFNTLLADAAKDKHLVVVDYYTQWCGPCKVIAPEVERMAAEYSKKGVRFAKMDCGQSDESKKWAMRNKIKLLPTFRLYSQTEQTGELTGTKMAELRAMIDKQLKK